MKENLSYRQLKSLIYVSNVLNSSLDLETILDSILQTTISVIDAADGGVLFLYDPDQDALVAKSTTGFDSMILNQLNLKPGESMTGQTFVKKECQIFQSMREVHTTTRSLTPRNLDIMERSIPRYPFSTLCAPILLKNEGIGVITIDSFQEDKEFSTEDVELLKAISHQAAIAIEKGNFYHEKSLALDQFKELNRQISNHNEMLSQSVRLHRDLADLVLKGKNLQDIIDYLHGAMGVNLSLFDRSQEELASCCENGLSSDVMEALNDHAVRSMSANHLNRQTLLFQTDGDEYHMLLLPIGLMPDLFGVLAVFSKEPLNEINTAAMEHACTVLSLEILKEEAIFDTQQKMKGDFLDQLLKGNMSDALLHHAKQLDIHPEQSFMVASLHFEQAFSSAEEGLLERRRMIHTFYRKCQLELQDSLILLKHDQMVILFSCKSENQRSGETERIDAFLHKQAAAAKKNSPSFDIHIGIGRWKKGLQEVHKSSKDANQVLYFIKQHGLNSKILHYSELGMYRLLMQTPADDIEGFIMDQIGSLLDDSKKKNDLLETLTCYINHNRNVKETADVLHIHPNTLHYRLNRIEELLDCRLDMPDQLLNIQMALKLYGLEN
ncbi:helix-turn-helix domain-containing protein [Rossellomorea aquimaris]|uniref:GAF domain-containing protein n=1 Tax=Rossellomorea aquimaris TaxID=189382 RepID=A0A1J6WP52_9BACI|nr:helix-turn-helix domain-containing protein [Rossellomorea aquimaris]OIU69695.1 hypothetical protein BHE18_01900 [Rossellomorea aquimaris]